MKLMALNLLLPGKIKKLLSRAHMHSLEQRDRNAHDQKRTDFKFQMSAASKHVL